MDDRETELSRFRQQWKEEVTRKTRPPSTASSSSSAPARPKAPSFSARKLSHSAAKDAPEDDHEGAADVVPLPESSVSGAAPEELPGWAPVQDPGSALEHYEKAVEKETQGSLGESLSLYRKAFRMDAKVDTQYGEKYFPRPPTAAKGKAPAHPPSTSTSTAAAPPTPLLATGSKEVAALIASFAPLHIQPALPDATSTSTSPPDPAPSPLSTLPFELLLQTLRALALTDIASFARSAQVCKALSFLTITEQSIWRDVCASTYSRMHWDWACTLSGLPLPLPLDSDAPEPEDPPRARPDDDNDAVALRDYAGNYRRMFISRPRVRFNGVYISTCNYVRSGASHSGWDTPVHIVTYFRYLRFYADGTVLSLLTTTEPVEVVGAFSRTALTPVHLRDPATGAGAGASAGAAPVVGVVGAWGRYVSRGRWRMDPAGRVDVETEPPPGGSMERYVFRMQMRVKSVRAAGRMGGSNKLAWEGFWSWNRLTDDLAEFSLRNDKAFFFSRVGSIERELGIV